MAAGVPSTNQILPFSGEALQYKTKVGAKVQLPGLFYNQPYPSAANLSSGTVTNSGQSLIGAFQLGGGTATTLPWGGDAVVTFSSSSGLLCSFTTSSFMPTTLNYNDFPVKFSGTGSYVLPTGIVAGQIYYWQWVSATTGRLAATPGGTVIAYTDAGSGTIYCQAANVAWGSPFVPAGFLQASDGLGQVASSFPQSGSMYRIEMMGHKIANSTNNVTLTAGLVTTAGATSFTSIVTSGTLAQVAAGPFPFKITVDVMIQQYGLAAASSPYVQTMIKSMMEVQIYTTAISGINTTAAAWTWAAPLSTKVVALDTTQALGFDIRALQATPAVADYFEPLWVRMWAYN